MSHATGGFYRILQHPRLYGFLQTLAAPKNTRRIIADDYIKAARDARVVDIGCGPGSMLSYLGAVDYTGFDLNESYIAYAKEVFGGRGTFIQGHVSAVGDQFNGSADIVIAIAVLHHLTDREARDVFKTAHSILKPSGRFITFDCVLTSPQNPIARLAIRLDRGKNVRTAEGYLALAKERFSDVKVDIRTDLLRIPYTHCIMTCLK